MFGLIYTSFLFLSSSVKKISDSICNNNQRINHQLASYDYPMYIDRQGRLRDVQTDEILFKGIRKVNGEEHFCIWSIKNQQIKKDLTLEENMKQRKKAIDTSQTVYPLQSGTYIDPQLNGKRYKDLLTNDIYVKRRIGTMCYAYMRVTDGRFIRPIDDTPEEKLSIAQEKIDFYNDKQKELTKLCGKMFPFNELVVDY